MERSFWPKIGSSLVQKMLIFQSTSKYFKTRAFITVLVDMCGANLVKSDHVASSRELQSDKETFLKKTFGELGGL